EPAQQQTRTVPESFRSSEPAQQQTLSKRVEKRPQSRIWSPIGRSPTPTSSEVIHRTNTSRAGVSPDLEARIIEAITRPIGEYESHHEAGARKEQAVADIIEQLGEMDAYHLQRRLVGARDDDPLAAAFRRLVPERRQRLLAALERHRRVL